MSSIKIGIYDFALHFIGGGQRYMCQIAQILSQFHQVDLITNYKISKEQLESVYGLNLRKVKLRFLTNKDQSHENVDLRSRIQKTYNKIKSKFFDVLKNEEINKFYNKIEPKIRKMLVPITRMMFDIIVLPGTYSLYEMVRDSLFNFLNIRKIRELFDKIELLTVNSIDVGKGRMISKLSQNYNIFINGEGGDCWYIDPKAKRNIMICHFPTPIINPKQSYIKNYEIYCDSHYSKKWVTRLWNVTPKGVLYPPVNFFQNRIPKKNYILYTARFIPIREQKKQSPLIKAFKTLYDDGITDYELHLIGSTSSYHSQLKYLKKLINLAKGYPIYFHINVDPSVIKRYYQESKIFWNLVGLNVDQYRYPQDIEHFGMTTVESMQNYCVPIVYNKGGLREIIKRDSVNGFLVTNINSLITKTKYLIENELVRKEMARNAFERGKELSLDNFVIRLLDIINGVS